MAHQGEAAGYYNSDARQQQYPPPTFQQQPVQYGQNYAPPQGPPPSQQNGYAQQNYGEKPSFEQTFKIERPKFNDWWAGLLFIAVFLGYVAVSGIAISGYCMCFDSMTVMKKQSLTLCSQEYQIQRWYLRFPK